jgi:hypothetical protein
VGALPGDALSPPPCLNTGVNGGSPRSTACTFATGFPPKRRVLMSIQMVLVSSPAKTALSGLLHQSTCWFRLCKQMERYRCARNWSACTSISLQAPFAPRGRSRDGVSTGSRAPFR